MKEQMEGIEARLLSTDDSTLDIKISMIENKGRGITSKRAFAKGEFIVEYAGELISDEESKTRWVLIIVKPGVKNTFLCIIIALAGKQNTCKTQARGATCTGSNTREQNTG